jgi:hypothetical protein
VIELDLSLPIARPSDRRRLIEGILNGSLGVDETTWLEWKSQVDWDSPVDVAIKIARHVIGFANRDPAEAQAFAAGEAYLVLLPDSDHPSRARIDPADIENKVSPYLGTDGPQWSAAHVDLNGNVSLLIRVAPPRPGDHIHMLRKQADKYPNGAIFVRRPGKTETANSTDIRRLEIRAQGAATQIALQISADHSAIPGIARNKKRLDDFLAVERDALLGPLETHEYQVGGGQRAVLEYLMEARAVMLMGFEERRTPTQFRLECERYLTGASSTYESDGHHLAALHGFGAIKLRATNPGPRNFIGVEIELLAPDGIFASRGTADEPFVKVERRPIPWGKDRPVTTVAVAPTLGSQQLWSGGPGLQHLDSGRGVVFAAFDLRPFGTRNLPVVYLLASGLNPGSPVNVTWRATAKNTDNRAEGHLTLVVADVELGPEDLLSLKRKQ